MTKLLENICFVTEAEVTQHTMAPMVKCRSKVQAQHFQGIEVSDKSVTLHPNPRTNGWFRGETIAYITLRTREIHTSSLYG